MLCEGAPHRAAWLGVFRLADGRFGFLRATCCGGGWTCHADGDAAVGERLDDLQRSHLTDAERRRIEA